MNSTERQIPVLNLQNVKRTYQSGEGVLEVLKGANLTLHPGEVVGLIGPSGSGKSSLLHAAGLLEKPDGGEVMIEGQACGKLSDGKRTAIRRAKIGFVYQFHNLLPEFSALDNAAAPMRISGQSASAARAEAKRLLAKLGLENRLTHQPGQLSGGEQQRVAIARALANKPRLILADEPTGNLDPVTSNTVFQALFAMVREEGVAALIATHNLELASHMDRVVTVENGLIEAV